MKKLIFSFFSFLICNMPLQAEIIKTVQIDEIVQSVTDDTLVLFNIAEVLMDTETSLGTQAWRKYIRSRLDSKDHDALSLFVFQNIPAKTPEPETASVVTYLQEQGFPVFAFTSRGRHEWYQTQIENIDILTENALRQIGIDFSLNQLPPSLANLDLEFQDYFHAGIIYATNSFEKGEILAKFLETTDYRPSKIVFVDDKADSLKIVEEAMNALGISFTGYAYSRTAVDHAKFNPMIAHIQLEWLLSNGQVLSDEEAKQIKEEQFSQTDPEDYFQEVMKKWHLIENKGYTQTTSKPNF